LVLQHFFPLIYINPFLELVLVGFQIAPRAEPFLELVFMGFQVAPRANQVWILKLLTATFNFESFSIAMGFVAPMGR